MKRRDLLKAFGLAPLLGFVKPSDSPQHQAAEGYSAYFREPWTGDSQIAHLAHEVTTEKTDQGVKVSAKLDWSKAHSTSTRQIAGVEVHTPFLPKPMYKEFSPSITLRPGDTLNVDYKIIFA